MRGGYSFHLLLIALLAASGCIRDSFFQRQRDSQLLRHENLPPPTAEFGQVTTVSATRELSEPRPTEPTPELPVIDRRLNQTANLSLRQALEIALTNSDVVRVFEGGEVQASPETFYDIEIAEEKVRAALAAFDASIEASLYSTRIKRPPSSFYGPGLAQPSLRDEAAFNFGMVKPLVTGGKARVDFNPDPGYLFIPSPSANSINPRHVGQVEFSIAQPLLQGAGIAVNRAPIQISQISANQTAWDFKKTSMTFVQDLLTAYWNLYAAHVALGAIDEVIPLLEEVVRLQEEAYRAEWLIEADVAKAVAQLAFFRQERIALESAVTEAELRLRHLMGVPAFDGFNLSPITPPTEQAVEIDSQASLAVALANQPDLVRQRLDVRIQELELMVAENQRLPKLDFEALYRMNGVGDNLGDALDQLATAGYADWQVGATFAMPLGRRASFALARAAERKLARQNALLKQSALTVSYSVAQSLRRIHYAYGEYQEAEKRVQAANTWVTGARLRYQNPHADAGGSNWLVTSLNDYLAAIRFRTDAVADAAKALANYNIALSSLEESKGTLLQFFEIDFTLDPCRQTERLRPSVKPAPLLLRREEILEMRNSEPYLFQQGPLPQAPSPAPAPVAASDTAPTAEVILLPPTTSDDRSAAIPRRFPPTN